MIVNIRGTHGSGKSTLVRQCMERFQMTPQLSLGGDVIGYLSQEKVARLGVVGPYRTACGGCDAVKTQEEVCSGVRTFSQFAQHVLFEGAVISTIYARYALLSQEIQQLTGHGIVFAYLDTPPDVCLERIRQRRAEAGNEKPLNPKNTLDKVRSVAATRAKFEAIGLTTVTLPWENALPALQELFK